MEHINQHFRQGDEHRFGFDFKTPVPPLSSVGFQNIHRRDFDSELDSADREIGTLYVNASKQKENKNGIRVPAAPAALGTCVDNGQRPHFSVCLL